MIRQMMPDAKKIGILYTTSEANSCSTIEEYKKLADKYDFEMHNGRNPLNWGRNIETVIGNRVAGKGQAYEINIYGSAKLTPFLPWIK